ncbi:hypothetical protein BYT27DRAFT_7106728 [Phlegmacium glaucopus]|nr:hypothetical protein BYT27DRAFT_7106728 [Phlegmacium glaucopus]
MRLILALQKLQEHTVLRGLSLDDIFQYARLVCHLKTDILLPQPLDQSDPHLPPNVLPLTIAQFLSDALGIQNQYIQDSWDILKYFIWECTTVELTKDDKEAFKHFGWAWGITALTIYPPENVCTNQSCENNKPLKKEISRHVVVCTLSHGVQPAWAVHLYCPGMCFHLTLYALINL